MKSLCATPADRSRCFFLLSPRLSVHAVTKTLFVQSPLVALAITAGLGLSEARATSKEFTNGDGNLSLTDGNNYNPTGLPAATDNIVLDTLGGSLTLSASSLNIEDINYSVATTTSISNTTTGSTSSTLTLNGGRGTSVPLFEQNSTKNFTISNGTTGALNVLLGTSGAFDIANKGNLTVSSNIGEVNSGTALTISNTSGAGTGTVTLSGTDSFTGGLVAAGAEVDVTGDASLGAAGGSVTINGGRLGFATNNTTIDPNRTIYLGANPTGLNTLSTLSIKGSTTIITVTYNGSFKNLDANTVGDLVKQGGSILQLGGVSNYSGNTFLNNGVIQLIAGTAGTNNRLPASTQITLGQAMSTNVGELDLNGQNQTIAGLASVAGTNTGSSNTAPPLNTNTVTTSTGTSVLTLGGTGTYAYGDATTQNSGIITGAITINKTGTGTQTLGGSNTYTGGTSITGGTLLVVNSTGSATGTGSVSIGTAGELASGAGSVGKITGLVTTSGKTSIIAPGATASSNTGTVGTLTLSGGLNIAAGATIPFDLGSSSSNSDLITISGGTFTGGTAASSVTFNFNTTATTGTYSLINYPNATASGVDLTDFAATGAAGSFSFVGNQLDFTISAVPEPATLLGGALVVGALGLNQRRRVSRWLALARGRGSRLAA